MRPIIFSTPMVKAILEGRKKQTRRIIKDSYNGCLTNGGPHPCPNEPVVMHPGAVVQSPIEGEPDIVIDGDKVHAHFFCSTMDKVAYCPYGKVGDILYVRETWLPWEFLLGYMYKADDNDKLLLSFGQTIEHTKWKPSIHMPKAAARIFLKITDIRVEALQDISWDDAVAEGCTGYRPTQDEPTHQFKRLWEEINGPESWKENPWVWVINFERTNKPEVQ